MRHFKFLSIFLIVILPFWGFNQGIEFYGGSFEDALVKAESEGKLVFVDGYATWCNPCLWMNGQVFSNEEVGAYFNEHFINLKLDLEKQENQSFAASNRVSAYPYLAFFEANGQIITAEYGARSVDGLLSLGKAAVKKAVD